MKGNRIQEYTGAEMKDMINGGIENQHLFRFLLRIYYRTGGKIHFPKTFVDWEPGCTINCAKCNLVCFILQILILVYYGTGVLLPNE